MVLNQIMYSCLLESLTQWLKAYQLYLQSPTNSADYLESSFIFVVAKSQDKSWKQYDGK